MMHRPSAIGFLMITGVVLSACSGAGTTSGLPTSSASSDMMQEAMSSYPAMMQEESSYPAAVMQSSSSSEAMNNAPMQPASAPSSQAAMMSSSAAMVPSTASVTIQNFQFSPSSLTVKQGTTVTWTNMDSASHTVTGGTGGPSSGTITTGASYSYTFNTVGTFAYHCSIHPSMTATVTVTQ